MADPKDKHYEAKFKFPLYQLIKKRAEEKDISYHDAAIEVMPEYVKTIRYRDRDFELGEIIKNDEENKKDRENWQKIMRNWSKKGE
jgi:hypothetical protein